MLLLLFCSTTAIWISKHTHDWCLLHWNTNQPSPYYFCKDKLIRPCIDTRKYILDYVWRFAHPLLCYDVVCVCTFKLFLQMRLLFINFLVKNLVVCVRASTAEQILFLNHRNRKVVGGTHNVLVHYVDGCAPHLHLSGVVLCNPFIWDNLVLFFLPRQQNESQNKPMVGVCYIETLIHHLHTTFVKIY